RGVLMASRPPNTPPGAPRRRPSTGMPSGWVWLMILGMFVIMWWVMDALMTNNEIAFTDLQKLADAGRISTLKFIDENKIEAELKGDANELPSDISDPAQLKKRIHNGKVTSRLPPNFQTNDLIKDLRAKGVEVERAPERGAWVGPVLMTLLPAVLIL